MDGSNIKMGKPSSPNKIEAEKEIRIDLPFHHKLENLAYIGINSEETWHVRTHYHDHFELCYIDEGKGWFSIDDLFYEVSAGNLFLTKPGEIHRGSAAGELPFKLYYFGFQLDQMRDLEMDFYQLGLHRVAKDDEKYVKRLCDQIFKEINSDIAHSSSMVQGYFIHILVYVIRTYRQNGGYTDQPLILTLTIKSLLCYLNQNVRFHHNIDELSKMLHISRTHLEREFKRYIGTSLGHYIRSLCIDRAKFLLTDVQNTITVIAEKLQFESVHKFSMFFKRMVGMSPSEYREMTINMK
jgi:AraC family L-rhamnose operon regulatory protein RhaS